MVAEKNIGRIITLLFAVLGTLCSCTTMYLPNLQNIPAFSKKGDLNVAISPNNYQLSYAPFKKFGFMVNGFNKNRGILTLDDGKTDNYRVNSYLIEAGVGVFKDNPKSIIEFFAGWGKGYGSISYDSYLGGKTFPGGGSSHFNKFFIQPNLVFGKGHIRTSISTRISVINFYDFSDESSKTLNSNTPAFFEPALTLILNYDKVSLKGQLQYSAPSADLNDSFGHYWPYHETALLMFAIEFHIREIFRKRE